MGNNIKRKILPITYPTVTSWPWHAILFSILETKADTKNWIYSNYIRLVGGMNNDVVSFDFMPSVIDYAICPWLKVQVFSREHLAVYHDDIKQFFVNEIANGSYIFAIINTQYAFENIHGKKHHERYIHETLIYGFDITLNKFYIADFTFRDKFSFEEVDMDCIIDGYLDVLVEEDYIAHRREGVFLLKFNERTHYKFDEVMVRCAMEDYLSGDGVDYDSHIVVTDNSTMNTGIERLGIKTYELIEDYIALINMGDRKWDIRVPHVLYDHKKLMGNRLDYMMKNKWLRYDGEILRQAMQISEMALQTRNMVLKSIVSGKKDNLKQIENNYRRLRIMEESLYNDVIKEMHHV